MILTNEQIKSVLIGAVNIKENEGMLDVSKCTDKQTDAWYSLSETLGYRACTTTGIRLDFYTNSKALHFVSEAGGKFEVLIDGTLRARFVPEDGNIDATLSLCAPNGVARDEVRVTLVFPSHTVGRLRLVELDDGSYIRPCKYDKKLLFIGDSITQGHASKFDTMSYAWRVTLHFNAESVINGIGGAFYHISTFDKPAFDPDAVILAYGTNDATRYEKNYDEMYRQVTTYHDLIKDAYPEKQIIVISPIFRAMEDLSPMGEWFELRRRMVEDSAASHGFHVISGIDLVPPLPDFYSDKYLHPNDLGFSAYALNLIPRLEKIFS